MVGPQGSNGGPLIYPQVACILSCLIGSCLINNYPYENHVSTGGTSSSCWECNLIMGVMTHYLFVLYYVPLSSNLTIEIFQECWTNAETTKQRAVNDTFYLICIHIFPLGSLTRHALFDASWIDGLMCLVLSQLLMMLLRMWCWETLFWTAVRLTIGLDIILILLSQLWKLMPNSDGNKQSHLYIVLFFRGFIHQNPKITFKTTSEVHQNGLARGRFVGAWLRFFIRRPADATSSSVIRRRHVLRLEFGTQ